MQHFEVFPKFIPLYKIAKKIGRDKKELKMILEEPSTSLFVVKTKSAYALPTPLFIYDAPFIIHKNYSGPHIEKFARLSKKFFEAGYFKKWENRRKGGAPRMRVLPIVEEIEHESQITPIEEVYSIFDRSSSFAKVPCPCRERTEVIGIRKCKDKYPILNCILLSENAELVNIIDDPVVKTISREEAKAIIKESAELGLVLATDNHATNTKIVCSCCGCCCGMLRGITELGNPRGMAKSNFIANVNSEDCTACETCLDRCKFGAIKVEESAQINQELCMGCGLCAVTCPNDAISLKRLNREEIPGQ
ncbi:MAG: hypothetical protein GY870_17600 [archaeon]|nr:hypothetical protein [archaeon]